MNVCIHVHEHIYNRKEDFCFTLLSPIVCPMEERFLFETRTHIFPHTLMTLTPTHWVTDLHYIDIYSLLCGGWALNPSTQIFRESLFIYWAKLPQNTFWDRISSLKLDVTGCLGWGGEKEREFCRPNCLYPLVLGGQLILMSTLHVGAGDLNLGTHACVLSALLANTSPQFLTEITFKSTCVVWMIKICICGNSLCVYIAIHLSMTLSHGFIYY